MLGPSTVTSGTVEIPSIASGTEIELFPGEDIAFKSNSPILRASWSDPNFQKQSYESCIAAAKALRKNSAMTCEDLYRRLAKARAQIAEKSPYTYSGRFGVFQETQHSSLVTPLARATKPEDLPAAHYADQWSTLMKALLSNPRTTLTSGKFHLQVCFHNVLLSSIFCTPDSAQKILGHSGFYVEHAHYTAYSRLKNDIEDTFIQLKKYILLETPDAEKINELLGRLHWLLAHACPLVRGSAATTAMCIRSVWKAIFPTNLNLCDSYQEKTFLEHAYEAVLNGRGQDGSVIDFLIQKGADQSAIPRQLACRANSMLGRRETATTIYSPEPRTTPEKKPPIYISPNTLKIKNPSIHQ